jgi:hypothetical protein
MPLGGRRRSWLTTSRAFPRRNGLRRNHAGAIASPSQRRATLPNFGQSPLKTHPEGAPTRLNGSRRGRFRVRIDCDAVRIACEATGTLSVSLANSLGRCPFRRWLNRLGGWRCALRRLPAEARTGRLAPTSDLRPVRLHFQ